MAREHTNKLLEMIEEGLLNPDTVILACLKYMSEDEVKDMMEANEFILDEEEEDEEEGFSRDNDVWSVEEVDSTDDFNYVGSKHHY